jgi:deoxyribodipyrimidine photo-lyase
MKAHASDERTYLYTIDDYLHYKTHDPYFNAAMKEMVETGFMHNYMRMYWAKKIIEWSKTHQEAYETTLYLNNKYFIDGRDPNSYTGVAWCFGKHDRAWTERPIFGKLRYMNDKGLERKFDMQGYINKVEFK